MSSSSSATIAATTTTTSSSTSTSTTISNSGSGGGGDGDGGEFSVASNNRHTNTATTTKSAGGSTANTNASGNITSSSSSINIGSSATASNNNYFGPSSSTSTLKPSSSTSNVNLINTSSSSNSTSMFGPHPSPITMSTLELVGKLEGHDDTINQARLLRDEDGVISISEDKTIRIWLNRSERGNYWPSVCHVLPSSPTCFEFDHDSRRLFVGLENGTISEFLVSQDYNRINHQRFYPSHQGKVSSLLYSSTCQWLLSAGRDKFFNWFCSETAYRLGSFQCQAACTSIQFDSQSKCIFVGDASGQITMLKLEQNTIKPITRLQGHQASIKYLEWDPLTNMLFSAGTDQVIICWDIGGLKGTAYELQGHRAKVTSLRYSRLNKSLISGGEDCIVVAWNFKAKRVMTPPWAESDICQKCKKPFFWNLKAMYELKTIGIRQHHCRNCGKAICGDCSRQRTTIPVMGFEFPVRVCDECFPLFSDASRVPLASFFNAKHVITSMDLNETKQLLLTTGHDRSIKLWNANCILASSTSSAGPS